MSAAVRRTLRATPLAALLMGAMALAQPEPAPPSPPAEVDAGTPPPPPPPPPRKKPPPAPDAGVVADAGTLAATPSPPLPHAAIPRPLADRARAFFTALLAGEPGPLVDQAELPFFLEDKRISSAEQLRAEWLNQLRNKRTDLLSLQGFEVLTPDEMERRFGKPPARLAGWPLRTGRTYLVVAKLSGHAAVALYHEIGNDWRIVAYHD
jgi:hypothetical protein